MAVGGNALQRRGDRLTIENQLKAAAEMAPTMAELAKHHELGTSSSSPLSVIIPTLTNGVLTMFVSQY